VEKDPEKVKSLTRNSSQRVLIPLAPTKNLAERGRKRVG